MTGPSADVSPAIERPALTANAEGGDAMFAAVRQYEMGAGFVSDFMQILDAEFADMLSGQPGFFAYHVIASGSDEIVAVTIFEDEDSVVRSNRLAAEFVRDRLGEFQLNLTSQMSGEIGVTRLASTPIQRQEG